MSFISLEGGTNDSKRSIFVLWSKIFMPKYPMRKSLPPLNALRVFQEAAKQNSFALAARTLNLTPAAVAYQVKQLEEFLAIELFERQPRGVVLTRAGVDYWQATSALLEQVAEETARLISLYGRKDKSLNVYTLHAIAEKWLLPRLASYPNADNSAINLVAVTRIGDDDLQNADICISFQPPPGKGFVAVELMREFLVPLCSPDYLRKHPQVLQSNALYKQVWLYDIDWSQGWNLWWAAGQQGNVQPYKRLQFSLYSLVIDAAIKGMGIAMGRQQLVQDEVAAGHWCRCRSGWLRCRRRITCWLGRSGSRMTSSASCLSGYSRCHKQ